MQRKLIITVCLGNIHRSVIAAYCLNRELVKLGLGGEIECESRGLNGTSGTPMSSGKNLYDYPRAMALTGPYLKEHGIAIPTTQVAKAISINDVRNANVLLAMDKNILSGLPNSLITQFPQDAFKIKLFSSLVALNVDIDDVGDSLDSKMHERVIQEIVSISRDGVTNLVKMIL